MNSSVEWGWEEWVEEDPSPVFPTEFHAGDWALDSFQRIAMMFYVMDPRQHVYKELTHVPDYLIRAVPYFFLFGLLEAVIQWWRGRQKIPLPRLNDATLSLSCGLMDLLLRLILGTTEMVAYAYVYQHFRIIDLPWDSPVVWYLAFISVDFCYYWFHRAEHEVAIIWAFHQNHHSAEDMNFTNGLRQVPLQQFYEWICYMPLAFFVPPTQRLLHRQFNFLYQFWIHTELGENLGPLELFLNTPSHHRVHHACNIYCLDKNYGGVLIIWDRMFGTFAAERKDETLVYGLIDREFTFNPIWAQLFYVRRIWEKSKHMSNWSDSIFAFVKGPGWSPGKPRLGDPDDVPIIRSREKLDVVLPAWLNAYLLFHYGFNLICFQIGALSFLELTPLTALTYTIYILASLTIFGLLFEARPVACALETVRCVVFLLLFRYQWHRQVASHWAMLSYPGQIALPIVQLYFLLSAVFWGLHSLQIKSKVD